MAQLRAWWLLGAALLLYYLYWRGYRVLVKDGVVLALQPNMTRALPVIDRVTQQTISRRVIITSGTDGRHSAGSKHYTGLAVDLRTHDLTARQVSEYAAALDAALNGASAWRASSDHAHSYDVIIERTHIHIEYDPAGARKGVIRL